MLLLWGAPFATLGSQGLGFEGRRVLLRSSFTTAGPEDHSSEPPTTSQRDTTRSSHSQALAAFAFRAGPAGPGTCPPVVTCRATEAERHPRVPISLATARGRFAASIQISAGPSPDHPFYPIHPFFRQMGPPPAGLEAPCCSCRDETPRLSSSRSNQHFETKLLPCPVRSRKVKSR